MEILCYTREPLEDIIYAEKLAYSMHLAWRREGEKVFTPFHHNEGLLYAKAVQNTDGTLVAKSLREPKLFVGQDGRFRVIAERTEADGSPDPAAEEYKLLWESDDLVHYREVGLISWEAADRLFAKGEAVEEVSEEEIAGIEGCQPGTKIKISDELGDYLVKKLMTPICEKITLTTDVGSAKNDCSTGWTLPFSMAYYSDGTMVERKVDWDDGVAVRTGSIHQEHFPFPFSEHRADPCCMYWHGKYYFIATNDADNNHTLYIRCADTLAGVQTAPETLLLDSETHPGIGGLLWAPEFHEIGGRMYIFHAATEGEFFREESRVMQLREGGDPMCREDWSVPHLVVKKDGSPLCEAGKVISLDMTTFEYEGDIYAMWSQRQFLPVDQGAWLYLAQIDEREPWRLVSDPVCVALPDYGWENNHTFVVEGPYAIWKDGQLMVTYSGAAVDATYAVGLLKPVMGSDILKPENWTKNNYPLLTSRSAEGEFGPGHNSYVTDENGLVWNFYHARPGVDGPRSSCARRVHFDIDGEPMLDVTEERDFPAGLEMPEGIDRRKNG